MRYFLFYTLLLLFLSTPVFSQESARDIIQKAEDRVRGNTSIASMTVRIVRPTWSRELKIKSWTKGKKLALILVTALAKDKGTVFLKRDKEVWNWIPSIERSIKLPPSMMSQNWMGTDFTNDDLVKESSTADDYTHKLTGDTVIAGLDCHRVEMVPKPEAAIVWGKVLVWVDKKDYMQMMVEFYDEDGALINRMTGKNIRMLAGRLLPSVMEMEPLEKKGYKTILIYDQLEFDTPLEDSYFSTQKMKLIR
jgi:outer membrane lipoprotein-sorting protein